MTSFDRTIYFDFVRSTLFGSLSQRQVDGQDDILAVWEWLPSRFPNIGLDLRWLAYMLATTYHETGQAMWPVEEYGRGKGMEYGEPDPVTGEVYYGRGDVQLTWADNYKRADAELGWEGDESCYLHPELQLKPVPAAKTMFVGMFHGWFRADAAGPQTLPRYFNATTDDAYGAREIINGDKAKIPDWSNDVSIGNLIATYHNDFLAALRASQTVAPSPLEPAIPPLVVVDIVVPDGISVEVSVNGNILTQAEA
jgi:putative chitinase